MDDKGQQILTYLREDDERGINMLFSDYFAALCQVAHRIVQNQDTSKDIVQDVFVRLWTHRAKLSITSSLMGYLRKSVVNASIDHQRRAYEQKKVALDSDEMASSATIKLSSDVTAEAVEGNELKEQVNSAVAQLPERCRLVFVLSRHEGLSYKEIAHKLDISPKTVENQMSKAFKLLRQSLAAVLSLSSVLLYYLFFFSQT